MWSDNLKRNRTPIGDMEDTVTEGAKMGVRWVEEMKRAIMPDGRPFGMEKQTKREEAEFYVLNLRGNMYAWVDWLGSRQMMLDEKLAGVRPEMLAEVDTAYMVAAYARLYSAEMEKQALKYGLIQPEIPMYDPMEYLLPSDMIVADTNVLDGTAMSSPVPDPMMGMDEAWSNP